MVGYQAYTNKQRQRHDRTRENHFNQPLKVAIRCQGLLVRRVFRLPIQQDAEGLDGLYWVCPLIPALAIVAVPDLVKQIRTESVLVRPYGVATQAALDSFQVADIGDVAVNPYNLLKTIDSIETTIDKVLSAVQI